MSEQVRKDHAGRRRALGLAGLAVLLWAVSFAAPGTGQDEGGEAAAAGGSPKEMFLAQRCDLCHAISSEGVEKRSKGESEKTNGPDLSTIETRSAEWIAAYLKKEEKLDGQEHQKTFKGSDADLTRLAEWLAELAAKPEA